MTEPCIVEKRAGAVGISDNCREGYAVKMEFAAKSGLARRAPHRNANVLCRFLPLSPLLICLIFIVGCGGSSGGSAPPPPANPSLSGNVSNIANVYPNATNGTYSITVSNALGSAATSGTVTVTDPPTNFTVTAISGTGWTCTLATLTCTRSDPLSAGFSYPPIVVVGTVTGAIGQSISIPITIAGGGQSSTANSPGSITIAAPYTIGGTISGLTGTGLVLQNNGGNNLSVNAGATSFTFSAPISGGSTYSVTVLTQPSIPAENCQVTNGGGTANANVTNVQVACAIPTYTIGGTVSGLTGAGLVLQDNGGDNLSVSANGTFTFATALQGGATYDVTVFAQPAGQTCTATNNSGTVATAAVTTVQVACATPAASTINFGTTYQTIRGFGGATAWLGPLTTAQATALFNPANGLGLSILRVRIDPEGSSTSTPPYFTSEWADELTNATEAQSANPKAIVFASPWTPPASMKTSSVSQPYYSGSPACSPAAGYCGGYLNPSDYAAYESYLDDFVSYFATNSVSLYAISMQNEPDFSAQTNENYESCSWTPQQMDTWVANNSSGLTTKLLMPESASFQFGQSDPTLSDATAVGHVSIIAGHLYGTSPSYYTNAENAGKDVWMTEHYLSPSVSGATPAIGDAIAAAEEVHNSMTVGDYNAYVWWWIWDNPADSINYGLINSSTSSPSPTYYGYAIGQFSKFIQPGAVRVSATNNASGVYVSSYLQG